MHLDIVDKYFPALLTFKLYVQQWRTVCWFGQATALNAPSKYIIMTRAS